MQESKEKIRNRMIKNASRLWGFQDTQAESTFDPLVGMILGALSGELAKFSAEISNTETRLLEKLVGLLSPEILTGPFPAHGILRGKPVEPVFAIDPSFQFFFNKRFGATGDRGAEEKPVFFTPSGSYKLFNGKVKYLAAGGKIFEIQEGLYKEVIATVPAGKSFNTGGVWIGLEMDEGIESLEGLSLCFDLRNEVYDASFYESLARAKWTLNGQPAAFQQGWGGESGASSLDELLKNETDVTSKVCSHIQRFYQKNFLTLTFADAPYPEKGSVVGFPARLKEAFFQNIPDAPEGPVTWIQAELPQFLPPGVCDDLFCAVNCFPVFNRHMNEFSQSSGNYLNILPLLSDELFFDVKGVTSSSGKNYTQKSFSGINEVENGTYILRQGGVGRFDRRNAAEMVNYLLELLRDESAAFAILGTDMIASNLKELQQTITRLENRLKESNIVKEEIPYLLLKASPGDETLFVEFWTTNGRSANNIKSGEKFSLYEGSELWPESIALITPTRGGRNTMNTEQRVNAYRNALLSHGRIVTKEDVKALCFEHFGNRLQKVEVKKGLQTGRKTDSGFMQTLDIYLTLEKASGDTEEDETLQFLKKDLLVKLEMQSANALPWRCFFIRG